MPYSNFNAYSRITTQTTTVLKAGSGVLHTITINVGTAATAAITVFDNTAASGTVIFAHTQGAAVPTAPVTVTLDARFNTGLTILSATANPDITVTFA